MNRPDGFGGPLPADRSSEWAPVAAHPGQSYGGQPYTGQSYAGQQYSGQPYAGQHTGPQHTGPQYVGQQYAGQPYPGHQHQDQGYAGQQYADPYYAEQQYAGQPYQDQSYAGQGYAEQPYVEQAYGGQSYSGQGYPQGHAAYPGSWGDPTPQQYGHGVVDAPRGPSTAKLVAFVLAGFLLLGLLGGGLLMIAADGATPPAPVAAPTGAGAKAPAPAAGASAITVTMPPSIDGNQQIDNQYAKQLVDGLRQQLAAAGSDSAAVGLYGQPNQPNPAFLVAASTTTYDTNLLLTGLAAGMQQSAGTQQITFVDQPAGPLGGTMRCADGQAFSVCIWGGEGVFGMNMVYGQDLAQAAATTLRVREAVEIHAS